MTPTEPPRFTPNEIAALPSLDAAAGTSGVAGIRTRILSGDPYSPGLYTLALQVPANTRIAAHRHRDPRSAMVVAGTWYFGFGDKADDVAEKALGPGSFYVEPANVAHFASSGSEPVTVYITGYGPTDTRYSDESTAPAAADAASTQALQWDPRRVRKLPLSNTTLGLATNRPDQRR